MQIRPGTRPPYNTGHSHRTDAIRVVNGNKSHQAPAPVYGKLATLEVANQLRRMGRIRHDIVPEPQASQLNGLWISYESFRERKEQPYAKWISCAASFGIAISRRSGYRACSGQCPAWLKPLYCSKECQIIVRVSSSSDSC